MKSQAEPTISNTSGNLFSISDECIQDFPSVKDSKSVATCYIDNLPNELLIQILAWVKASLIVYDYSELARITTYPVFPRTTIEAPIYKTLRQVCQKWSQIATPLLFERIILNEHPKSWTAANLICNSNLAYHVRTIKYSCTPSSRQIHNYVNSAGGLRDARYGWAMINESYNELALKWYRVEHTMPPLDIHLLPRLDRLDLPAKTGCFMFGVEPKVMVFLSWTMLCKRFEELKRNGRKLERLRGGCGRDKSRLWYDAGQQLWMALWDG